MNKNNSFSILSDDILEKLNLLNINYPTQVQNQIIPIINEQKNILFESETGTGKTFAYLLPLINRLENDDDKTSVKILIIAPTFELASQINANAKLITNRKTALFIGGSPIKRQIEVFKEKPQIVIGNAARIVELIRLKKLKINNCFAAVFDECDRLIKKESLEDTKNFQNCLPRQTQIIACSATLTKQCKIFFAGMDEVIIPKENILKEKITHIAIFAEKRDKIDVLRKFLAAEKPQKALIFTSRSDQVENIFYKLTYKKINCVALYSKEDKQKRKSSFDKFKSGKVPILITSDLGARGLDIPNITHIIQMDLPEDDDFFIHRCGRTARFGKTGTNVVIGDAHEMMHFSKLEKKLGFIVYPKQIIGGKLKNPIIEE